MPETIACPTCLRSDQVQKVSTLYLNKSISEWRKFSPPASGKTSTFRALHPDLVVISFSLILPVFIYGILNQQPSLLIPVLIGLIGAYSVYFFTRNRLIEKFKTNHQLQVNEKKRLEKAIGDWMKLYYCAREELVFIPGGGAGIPVDQMMGYLLAAPSPQKRP